MRRLMILLARHDGGERKANPKRLELGWSAVTIPLAEGRRDGHREFTAGPGTGRYRPTIAIRFRLCQAANQTLCLERRHQDVDARAVAV